MDIALLKPSNTIKKIKTGFVRLPTNAEWEFASRGGVAVDEAAFRENTFTSIFRWKFIGCIFK